VFVPEQYDARAIDGTMIDARRFREITSKTGYNPALYSEPVARPARLVPSDGVLRGQVRGRVHDLSGSSLPGVTVSLAVGGYQRSVVSDAQGSFTFSGVPNGDAMVTSELAGFQSNVVTFPFDGSGRRLEVAMQVGAVTETVTVSAESPIIDQRQQQSPSANVVNLQQRAAGVLPIRVDVPRAGVSHEFIKPLVIGAEATVTLRYKRR
jgi:hypothetical protein